MESKRSRIDKMILKKNKVGRYIPNLIKSYNNQDNAVLD